MADKALSKDSDWNAPYLWRSEFRNVLMGYLRRKQMTLEEVLSSIGEAEKQMRDREHYVESASVIDTALAAGCTAYDAEYVALAKHLGVRLVTSDTELLKKFPNIAVSLQDFVGA
jgi:predicted nucleic acid-binding protein